MTVFFGILAAFSLFGVIGGSQKATVVCSTICFTASLAALVVMNVT